MPKYYFYYKGDSKQEPINKTKSNSRLKAAKYFAKVKNLKLKEFLEIFGVNKQD